MAFQPFQSVLANQRAIRLPDALDEEARQRLIAKLTAAARQQEELAEKSFGVLRLTDEPFVEGDLLLIPHEPAAPLDPTQLEESDERPDIRTLWWLSLATLDALKHAAAAGAPHGGIQSGALYRDEAGRIKLGDFGIAPAFETVCGIDHRRQIHCDATVAAGDPTRSGTWALLGEDAARDYGWITPYFAHELLEGKLRLNPKSDQFALATLLFLLATGTHPYGAALSDPTMMFYFHLEPYEIRDERGDWTDAFERFDQELSGSDDAPIIEWARMVRTMLASDSGQRFANPAEIEKQFAPVIPPAWRPWLETVGTGEAALIDGDVSGFLQAIESLDKDCPLPDLAAEPFSAWVGQVTARKDEIARARQREHLLDEANTALDDLDLVRTRELAEQILADDGADDAQRAAAEDLLKNCTEHEEFMKSGADALAEAYLKSARECLDEDRLAEARQLLDGVLQDPGTPPGRAAQARELLTEVELVEQRTEQQLEALNAAAEDGREGRYQAGRQRLEALLEESAVPPALAEQARLLLDDFTRLQAARAEYVAALDDARSAWERADADAVAEALARVPETVEDREVSGIRADLSDRLKPLQAALATRDAVSQAERDGDLALVVNSLLPLVEDESLPQLLRDECRTRRETARAELDKLHRERIEAAEAQLVAATEAYAVGELERCRQIVRDDVLREPALPDSDRQAGEHLLRLCDTCDEVVEQVQNARDHAAAEAFSQGLTILDTLTLDDLPEAVTSQVDAARAEIEQAGQQHAEAQREHLRGQLDELPPQLAAGQLDAVGQALVEIGGSPFLDASLQRKIDPLRVELERQRPIQTALEEIERALQGDPDLRRIDAALAALPDDPPEWARIRIDAAREQVAGITAARHRAMQDRAAEELEAIDELARQAQVETARQRLDQLDPEALDETPAARWRELDQQLKRLESWVPKIEQARQLLAAGDVPKAHRTGMALAEDEQLPAALRPQLDALLGETKQRIVDRRAEIDAAFDQLDDEMQRRGKRARDFETRVAALQADPMATKAQKTRGGELLTAFAELPEPQATPWALYAGGGAIGLIVIAAIGYFMTRPTPQEPVEPIPDPPRVVRYTEQIDAARQRLAGAFDQLARFADQQGRTGPEYTLTFEPEDTLPTTLVARGGNRREPLGQAATLADLDLLTLPDDLLTRLWQAPREPDPTPQPPPTLADRIAAVTARLDQAYAQRRDADDPEAHFAFDSDQQSPGRLALVTSERTIDLGPVSDADLDNLRFDPAWLTTLRLPRQMRTTLARLQQQVDDARASAMGSPAGYTVSFDPPAGLPADLIATAADDARVERLTQVRSAADLPDLQLTDAWSERLFPPPPPPSLFELVDATRQAVAAAVPELQIEAAVRGDAATLTATWQQVRLLPLNLRITSEDTLQPDAAGATKHFEDQVAVLADLTADGARWLQLDPDYDDRLRPDWAAAEVEQVAAGVALAVPTSLAGAPDPDARFLVNGFVENGTLQPDNPSRQRWEDYLQQVRGSAWQPLVPQWQQQLELPEGLRLVRPESQPIDEQVTLDLLAGNDVLLNLTADWVPAELTYTLDVAAARAALSGQIAAEISQAGDQLAASWPQLRDALAQNLRTGGGVWPRAELDNITVQPPAAGAYTASVQVDATIDGNAISIPAAARWTPRGVAWAPVTSAMRQSLDTAMTSLGSSPAWQAAARDSALDQLRQQNVAIGSGAPETSGDQLALEVENGDRYTWKWDPAALAWASPTRMAAAPVPQPPAGLDAQLAQLASQGSVSQDALAGVLLEVARAKQERVGGKLTARQITLQDATERFRRTVANDITTDPYPNVFVEYFVGQQSVYALSWQIKAGQRDRISEIRDVQVWEVMPTSALRAYSSASAMRADYARPGGLGAKLLGPAIGNRIEAGTRGAYGVAVAPDGPLWLVRWEQVEFGSATVSNLGGQRTPPQQVSRLYDLVRGELDSARNWNYNRAGIWCTPSFAFGPASARQATVTFNQAGPGGEDLKIRFQAKRTAGNRMVGRLLDPGRPTAPNLSTLINQANQLVLSDLGRFWNIGWEGSSWQENPVLSLAVLLAE